MGKKVILAIFLVLAITSIIKFINVESPKTLNVKSKNNFHYQAKTYSPIDLDNLMKGPEKDKYVIIDVRTRLEYDKGHLPGAIHAVYFDTEGLIKAAGNKIPITYCAFSAMRGPYATYQLYRAGFKNASLLDGGISAWAEDIQGLDSKDPQVKTVFNHPKNIFPDRPASDYPKNQGEIEINVVAKKYEFEPSEIKVKHGQKVTLNLTSRDVTHGFSLPEYGIEEELLPNEAISVTFVADRIGTFPFVCSVICGAGHDHASMIGELIVE